jgi:hypothetical protein
MPTTQITRTRYPFPGNGFITGTITPNHYEVFLPFLAAANSEDSNQLSSDYRSVLLQLMPVSEIASPITTFHGPNGKHSLYCWRRLFTGPMPSNRHPIVPCIVVRITQQRIIY